jgi:hypothetical protein
MDSMPSTTSKQRRDKTTNKAQQDEEEERGNLNKSNIFEKISIHSSSTNHLITLLLFRNNQSLRW